MQPTDRLIAIYDFEFFPYALGDVLTWNIRTAMRCEELGKKKADLYICLDERFPASIYQRGLINPDNFDLFFSELYGAFTTNPKLGSIFIFRNREEMLNQLSIVTRGDEGNKEAFDDYLKVMKYSANNSFVSKSLSFLARKNRIKTLMKKMLIRAKRIFPKKINEIVLNTLSHEYALNEYFIQYVYSHEAINAFYSQHKTIPHLQPSLGCVPDVDEIIAQRYKDKILVPFHLRLRRLDVGYGGDHSYARDSNFLEWYDFLQEAAVKQPQVQFIALGRLQEKPLALLRLPNVSSLRLYGMGLGHELTLMLKSHFFIGSSSGFAALANFSSLPYFITRMNPGSCKAYAIPEGAGKLPFANENQKLIYEEETSALLMRLLEEGLKQLKWSPSAANNEVRTSGSVNVHAWLMQQAHPNNKARTTSRFYHDGPSRQEETVYLLLPYLETARIALISQDLEKVRKLLFLLEKNFPELCEQMPQYLFLRAGLAAKTQDTLVLQDCLGKLAKMALPPAWGKIFNENEVSLTDKLKACLEAFNFAEVGEVV